MSSASAPAPRPVHGLLARVVHDIMTDKACLPSMPDVALRIRASMQQDDYTAETVAKVIKADPGTSVYLVRIANSALYGGAVTIESVEDAIVRLGMPTARNLVTAHALKAMFQTRSRELGKLMQSCWIDSARRAALAAVIAAHVGNRDPDRAMLAGLLADIGVLPLIGALEQRSGLPDAEQLAATLDAFAPKIGVLLLDHWGFDDDIVDVARNRKNWWRDDAPGADLTDIVLIARLHASVGTAAMHDLPRINEIPAFAKLPLGDVGPDQSLEFLRAADAEVREVMQMLGVA